MNVASLALEYTRQLTMLVFEGNVARKEMSC